MATLAAQSRLESIDRSVFKYVDTQMRIAMGLTVYYQDSHPILNVNDLSALPDQWAEVYTDRLSPQTRVYDAGAGGRLSLMDYLININLFELRERASATLYSLSTLGDKVNNLFLPNVKIPIRDYDAVGDPIVASLEAYREPDRTKVATPESLRQKVSQLNLSVTMQYTSVSVAVQP